MNTTDFNSQVDLNLKCIIHILDYESNHDSILKEWNLKD